MNNQEAAAWLSQLSAGIELGVDMHYAEAIDMAIEALKAQELKNSTQEVENSSGTDANVGSKYEYHYDHTDCIWYRPEARNRCPATCAQYRDGWNDAMNYIFRDGKGYRPYRRNEQYGE